MPIRTVTAKGQVTLGKELLDHLGAEPGSMLDVTVKPDGRIALALLARKGTIADVFGALKRDGQEPISIEDMNEAIAQSWAGEA